jgi:hypothetical protein
MARIHGACHDGLAETGRRLISEESSDLYDRKLTCAHISVQFLFSFRYLTCSLPKICQNLSLLKSFPLVTPCFFYPPWEHLWVPMSIPEFRLIGVGAPDLARN